MKRNTFSAITLSILAGAALCSCEDEKDLIVIEGNLPIKTQTLFMVGDATPNGWSIDSPTPLTATEADPLVFEWEGKLNKGEMKLCLVPGSWDVGFIRPTEADSPIGKEAIDKVPFQMHAGDPDEKWKITDAGQYKLTFDLRNWTMSSAYLGEPEAPKAEPIDLPALYIVGDATPNGWAIDNPTPLAKDGFIYTYEGHLNKGEMKACAEKDSWDQDFIRPASNGVKISKEGVEDPTIVFTANPDDKWVVEDAGQYKLTFDLENCRLTAVCVKADQPAEPDPTPEPGGDGPAPLESQTLYMIGDATPNGWSMDDATAFTSSEPYIFTWEGELVTGEMKACLEPDGTFSCPFLRPAGGNVTISAAGVSEPGFVYTTDPDDKWKVTDAGRYRLTFDLRNWTLTATKL